MTVSLPTSTSWPTSTDWSPSAKRRQVWSAFLIALTLKFGVVVYLSTLTGAAAPHRLAGRLAITTGDTPGYLGSIDNFIDTGEYYSWNGVEKVRAGRMPYYGSLYYLFRLVADKRTAYDSMVITQIIVEAISVVLLGLLSYSYLRNAVAFWMTYAIALLSLNSTIYSLYLAPESLSISFLIICLFFYDKHRTNRTPGTLTVAGLFLGLVVLLKPYLVVLYVPIVAEILWVYRRGSDRESLVALAKKLVAFGISLAVLLSPWVVRNYLLYERFIPFQVDLTAGAHYTEADLAYRKFVRAWGGSIVFWDKRSAGCYFVPRPDLPCEFSVPEYALANGYSLKDIEDVRRDYIELQRSFSESLVDTVARKFDRLTNIYKTERPLRYYVISGLLTTKALILHSGSWYLPMHMNLPSQAVVKLSQSALYYLTLVLGTIGLIILTVKHGLSPVHVFVPVFLALLFGLVLRLPEFRYFNHTYPLFVVGTTYSLTTYSLWRQTQRFASQNL